MHRLDFERGNYTQYLDEIDESDFFEPPKPRSRDRNRHGGRKKRAGQLRNDQWASDNWAEESREEQAWAEDEWTELDHETWLDPDALSPDGYEAR